jgi:hypothetical protein
METKTTIQAFDRSCWRRESLLMPKYRTQRVWIILPRVTR